MALNLAGPEDHELRARITVFGVGGAGGNAVAGERAGALAGRRADRVGFLASALGHDPQLVAAAAARATNWSWDRQ